MVTRKGFVALFVAAVAMLGMGATKANAQSIDMVMVREGNGKLYEVRSGSGTGGRFVESPRSVRGVAVAGYTDRVQRGEYFAAIYSGASYAEYATIRSDNGVVNTRWNNFALPNLSIHQAWLSPYADNVMFTLKLPGKSAYQQRLPIGTRPAGVR